MYLIEENLEFPEWTKSSEFLRRDEILSKSAVKAIAVITNTEIIKIKSHNFTLLKRIYIINHRPSAQYQNLKNLILLYQGNYKKFNLPEKYILPRNVSSPQNHKYVIDTIILNEKHKLNISAVFGVVIKVT